MAWVNLLIITTVEVWGDKVHLTIISHRVSIPHTHT